MKTGMSLTDLAREIERQADAKRDYVAPTSELQLYANPGIPDRLDVNGHGSYGIAETTHRQLGEYLKIPAVFYDSLRGDHREVTTESGRPLYEETVNALLWRKDGDRRMVRTLDGSARAFLSDKYRPLDNDEIANAVLPAIFEMSGIAWEQSVFNVSETRMELKIVNQRVRADVKVGDTVQAGVLVRNSEVGHGSFSVQPMVMRLVCLNGMVVPDFTRRKYHAGGRIEGGADGWQYLQSETIKAKNAATVLEMRDLIKGALSEVLFGQVVDKLRESTTVRITGKVDKAVEVLGRQHRLTSDEQGSVLRHLIEGGDLSMWGVANAVTRAAQDAESFDRSTELEAIGGRIIELEPHMVREVVAAK